MENDTIGYYLKKIESNKEEELKTSHTEQSWYEEALAMNQAEQYLNQTSWKLTSWIAEVVAMNEVEQEIELDNFAIEKMTQEEGKPKNPRKESRHTDQEQEIWNPIATE